MISKRIDEIESKTDDLQCIIESQHLRNDLQRIYDDQIQPMEQIQDEFEL